MKKTKKAQFVEVDFFLALLILTLGIILITAPFINTKEDIQADRLSYDAVSIITTMKLSDFDDTTKNNFMDTADNLEIVLKDEDTIAAVITKILVRLEQADNPEPYYTFAQNVIEETLKDVIPDRYKYEVMALSGENTYNIKTIREEEKTDIAAQSRTLLTGLEVGRPISGFTASASLNEVKNTDSVYEFIGGFIGQGNITFNISVPSNEIIGASIEGLFQEDFEIRMNDEDCGSYSEGFIQQELPLSCIQHINEGPNKVEILFNTQTLTDQYISGGFIKIDYNITQNLQPQLTALHSTITKRKNIPSINGIINIYDSIYVPGELRNVKLVLNHDIEIIIDQGVKGDENDAELFFIFGNETIYKSNESGPVKYENNSVTLNYDYEDQTIPYRLGFPELTTTIERDIPLDVVYIADLSGSMFSGQSPNIPIDDEFRAMCGWQPSKTTATRIELSACLTTYFIEELLGGDGDVRMGIVGYGTNALAIDIVNLTTDVNTLTTFSNNMVNTNRGWTCTSCGIAAATNLLMQDELNRTKIMIVMTDGMANKYYGGGTQGHSNGALPPNPPVIRNYNTVLGGSTTDVSGSESDSLYYADFVKDNEYTNMTVYSFSFAAPSGARPFLRSLSSNNHPNAIDPDGEYFFEAEDEAGSFLIAFNSILEGITAAAFVSQVIDVEVDAFDTFESSIYDSYIEYQYTPSFMRPAGRIRITNEEGFSNEDCDQIFNLNLHPQAQIGEGFLTSYTGNIWTTRAEINEMDIFNYDIFNELLGRLGDPFVLGIPNTVLRKNNNNNEVSLTLSDGTIIIQDCNENNKLIYDVYYPSSFSTTTVQEKSTGCIWEYTYQGNPHEVSIPSNYEGTERCFLPDTYGLDDTMHLLGYQIINGLTHDDELVIDLANSDFRVNIAALEDIPYMWGPSIIGVTVWR